MCCKETTEPAKDLHIYVRVRLILSQDEGEKQSNVLTSVFNTDIQFSLFRLNTLLSWVYSPLLKYCRAISNHSVLSNSERVLLWRSLQVFQPPRIFPFPQNYHSTRLLERGSKAILRLWDFTAWLIGHQTDWKDMNVKELCWVNVEKCHEGQPSTNFQHSRRRRQQHYASTMGAHICNCMACVWANDVPSQLAPCL